MCDRIMPLCRTVTEIGAWVGKGILECQSLTLSLGPSNGPGALTTHALKAILTQTTLECSNSEGSVKQTSEVCLLPAVCRITQMHRGGSGGMGAWMPQRACPRSYPCVSRTARKALHANFRTGLRPQKHRMSMSMAFHIIKVGLALQCQGGRAKQSIFARSRLLINIGLGSYMCMRH